MSVGTGIECINLKKAKYNRDMRMAKAAAEAAETAAKESKTYVRTTNSEAVAPKTRPVRNDTIPSDNGITLKDILDAVGDELSGALSNYRKQKMRERAKELLDIFGLKDERNTLACNLPYGKQRKLEIARALATNPKLLLLDEPAAGMNPNETAELMDTIRFINKEFDMTILLIEHDMKLVAGICEKLTVLNFGQVLAQGNTSEVLNDPAVITAYLGEDE